MKRFLRAAALLLAALLTTAAAPAAYAEGEGIVFVPGETVLFGSYEQDGVAENGPEPLEWTVLDVRDCEALLICTRVTDFLPYHERMEDVTWETSTLRAWLNGEFLETAFCEEERERIAVTAVENPDSERYGTPGGADTEDRIFLPGIAEAGLYFPEEADRTALPTFGALIRTTERHMDITQGIVLELCEVEETEDGPALRMRATYDGQTEEAVYRFSADGGTLIGEIFLQGEPAGGGELRGVPWWLRSPGDITYSAAYVTDTGAVEEFAGTLGTNERGIRPMLWISIDGG